MELSSLPPRVSHIEVDFDGETVKLAYDTRKISNSSTRRSEIDALATCIVSWDITSGGVLLLPEEYTPEGWQKIFDAVPFAVLITLWDRVWADFLALTRGRGKS